MPLLTLFGGGLVSSPTSPALEDFAVRGPAHRYGEEWYMCGRCGKPFPRAEVIVQNGLIVCTSGSQPCFDEPGYDVFRKQVQAPYEQPIDPLPYDDEEI